MALHRRAKAIAIRARLLAPTGEIRVGPLAEFVERRRHRKRRPVARETHVDRGPAIVVRPAFRRRDVAGDGADLPEKALHGNGAIPVERDEGEPLGREVLLHAREARRDRSTQHEDGGVVDGAAEDVVRSRVAQVEQDSGNESARVDEGILAGGVR